MLNHITIMGRLTRDPELHKTATSGVPVADFTVAVDRDYKTDGERECDFIDCVAWRHNAEFVSQYFTKGSIIVVDGRLEMRSWTSKDGNRYTKAEIVAQSVYFGDTQRRSNGSVASLEAADELPVADFAELNDEDQHPF